MMSETPTSDHSIFQKGLWRFVLLFLILYSVPYDMTFGFTYALEETGFWDPPVIWLGENLFGWTFNKEALYIGFDSKYEFSRYTLVILLSLIMTSIWIVCDHYFKKNYDARFKIFVQTILRYNICFSILSYGMAKIIGQQFGNISLDDMQTSFGDTSAMGLMWTFFSYSSTVTVVSGWLEVIGGVLLLFRKTTYLGAVLLLGVMANVVLFDIGYNVSVTFYAIQIFTLILILLSDQFKSLYHYLVLSKPAKAAIYKPLFTSSKSRKLAMIFKVVLIASMGILFSLRNRTSNAISKNETAWFTNKQTIDLFIRNGDTIAAGADTTRWKQLTFNGVSYYPESFQLEYDNGSKDRFSFAIDSTTKTIKHGEFIDLTEHYFDLLYTPNDSIKKSWVWEELRYNRVGDTSYILQGIFKEDTIYAKTSSKEYRDYSINKRRGKWIWDL